MTTDREILDALSITPELLEEVYEQAAPSVDLPRQIGPYRLLEQIGRGSCGRVYRAVDTTLGRTVAVKLLAEYAGNLAEARRTVAVSHPNIVQVITADELTQPDGTSVPYIVYEYVDGPTLDQYLATRGRRARLQAARDVARGLSAVHAAGVAHGDVRTPNILMDGDRPKVADFGCESAHEAEPGEDIGRVAALAGVRPKPTMARLERALTWRLRRPAIIASVATVGLLVGVGTERMLAARRAQAIADQRAEKLERVGNWAEVWIDALNARRAEITGESAETPATPGNVGPDAAVQPPLDDE